MFVASFSRTFFLLHHIYTGEYLFVAVRYVERNPVKAKIVKRPWDYPWSSARFHVGLLGQDQFVMNSPLLNDIQNWKGFLSTESDLSSMLQEKSEKDLGIGAVSHGMLQPADCLFNQLAGRSAAERVKQELCERKSTYWGAWHHDDGHKKGQLAIIDNCLKTIRSQPYSG